MTDRAGAAVDGHNVGALCAGLAMIASVVCALTPQMATVHPVWFVPVTAGAVLYRWWFERALRAEKASVVVGFWLHVLVMPGLVVLHPLYGVYVFTGYLDAPRALRGVAQAVGIVAVACALSFAQIGGVVAQWASVSVYLAFVALNVAIAATMSMAERRRERDRLAQVRTVERLLAAEKENSALQARLAVDARRAGQLDERARLSREIHDTVAQGLVGIIRQLDAVDPVSPEDRDQRIERARSTAQECLLEARRAVSALASPMLDEDDLPTALAGLVRQRCVGAKIEASFNVDGHPAPGAHDSVLVRVAQEALTNVVRHSGASRVAVSLAYAPGTIRLDVRDDGRGFDPARAGYGLRGIRQRVNDHGGTFELETAPGHGCALAVEVPAVAKPAAEFSTHGATTTVSSASAAVGRDETR